MSTVATKPPTFTSNGYTINPDLVAPMRDSSPILGDVAAMRERMATEGYLYLPGFHPHDEVMTARRGLIDRLQAKGFLHPDHDPMDGILAPGKGGTWDPALIHGNAALMQLLYQGRMISFFEEFLGGAVRHFDYTWVRAMGPGMATPSHCDVVYMGRGTKQLYTVWTPIGDAPYDIGGLIVLEGTHRNERLRNTYGQHDVDTYCENKTGAAAQTAWERGSRGHLGKDPNQIQRSLGGVWRVADYRAGDIVVFTTFTVHASTDNRSNRIRLSTDTRYQLGSEPIDERWIGENPPAHGIRKGLIC